jgi:hypothetical protein
MIVKSSWSESYETVSHVCRIVFAVHAEVSVLVLNGATA